jgi:predicted flap endonuclease-1-like 5' DNA nuclease
MANLVDIEGIGSEYAEKLQTAGLTTTQALLDQGGTPAGRKALAERSGISEARLLEWVNHADLYRIRGIGSEYADLLEEAGVDSVPELAQRNAGSLAAKIAEINETKELVRRVPDEAEVSAWIQEAKTMPRAVSY